MIPKLKLFFSSLQNFFGLDFSFGLSLFVIFWTCLIFLVKACARL